MCCFTFHSGQIVWTFRFYFHLLCMPRPHSFFLCARKFFCFILFASVCCCCCCCFSFCNFSFELAKHLRYTSYCVFVYSAIIICTCDCRLFLRFADSNTQKNISFLVISLISLLCVCFSLWCILFSFLYRCCFQFGHNLHLIFLCWQSIQKKKCLLFLLLC